MIAEMVDGAPRIARHRGKIAILATDDGADHGFLLTLEQALTTAVRIMAAVADAKGSREFSFPCDSVELSRGREEADDRYAQLALTVERAPLTVDLTATQVAELAVVFAAAATELDAPKSPRRDW